MTDWDRFQDAFRNTAIEQQESSNASMKQTTKGIAQNAIQMEYLAHVLREVLKSERRSYQPLNLPVIERETANTDLRPPSHSTYQPQHPSLLSVRWKERQKDSSSSSERPRSNPNHSVPSRNPIAPRFPTDSESQSTTQHTTNPPYFTRS